MKTADKLSQILTAVEADSIATLRGKFHAHLTLEISPEQIDACRAFCGERRVKLTIIDLENLSGRSQTDVMVTAHFRDPDANAVQRITQQLLSICNQAEEAGFSVLRSKLEHESLPSLDQFSREQYHEVHVKLKMPADTFADDYKDLVDMGRRLGFVPSRNPLQRESDYVTQFVNLRIYEGDRASADTRVEAIVRELADHPFDIVEVKRESVVYDTDQALDAWWN